MKSRNELAEAIFLQALAPGYEGMNPTDTARDSFAYAAAFLAAAGEQKGEQRERFFDRWPWLRDALPEEGE